MSAGGDEVQIDIQSLKRSYDPFLSFREMRRRQRDSSTSEEESVSAGLRAKRDKAAEEVCGEGLIGLGVGRREKAPHLLRLKRSNSADDLTFMAMQDALPLEYMSVDVELCAQWLIAHRRKAHIEAVESTLQVSSCSTILTHLILNRPYRRSSTTRLK